MGSYTGIKCLAFLVALQVAALGLLRDSQQSDVVSFDSLVNIHRLASVGSLMPVLSYCDGSGKYRNGFAFGRPATLIFTGCPCKTDTIKSLADAAVGRHEEVAFFITQEPSGIKSFVDRYKIQEPVYSVRITDEFTTLKTIHYPLVLHLSSTGLIIGLEQP